MTQETLDPTIPELHIAGFTISYCDDGSAYLEADNCPGEGGVSVRIDQLSAALSGLYVAAKNAEAKPASMSVHVGGIEVKGHAGETRLVLNDLNALDALDIPEGDMAARVVDREVSFDDDADCEGCKI